MPTPLMIEIALHYHCSPTEFPRVGAQAVDEAIREMLDAGILKHGPRHFLDSDGLTAYVEALCAVPFPYLHQEWRFPAVTDTGAE